MPRYFTHTQIEGLIMVGDDGHVYYFQEAFEPEEEESDEDVVEEPKKAKRKTRGGGVENLSDEEKKAKKREYMRKWLAKKKNKQQEEKGNDLIDQARQKIEDRGLPIEMVNKYGMTAVEVILNEKNRGIGYTADEIYEMADKRLKILNLTEITEIYEALENAGL